jgi:Rps23 Pro-64 3,4-dihydroxylase Tpa1-like proline 4-hydroxylase
MRVVDIDFPYDMLVLDDVYTEEQQGYMWQELEYLYKSNMFLSPDDTGSAKYDDGSLKKSNKSVFLSKAYPKEYYEKSALIMIPRTTLLAPEVTDLMYQKNPCHGILVNINKVSPLISYYEDQDHYDFHYDESAYSTLSYLIREPRAFSGGEVTFKVNEAEVTIPIENNRVILFPSSYPHAVSRIDMDEKDKGKMLGRFSISQFLLIHAGE